MVQIVRPIDRQLVPGILGDVCEYLANPLRNVRLTPSDSGVPIRSGNLRAVCIAVRVWGCRAVGRESVSKELAGVLRGADAGFGGIYVQRGFQIRGDFNLEAHVGLPLDLRLYSILTPGISAVVRVQEMLDLDDSRWTTLRAGYRIPVDLRPYLAALETGEALDAAWHELWQELYHQGDIGEGSLVVVPHLVRIHRERGVVDWNTYAIVGAIELARNNNGNPDCPDWANTAYHQALRELGLLALAELPKAFAPEAVSSILAILAITKGARTYARMLLDFSEDEILEIDGLF